MPNSSALVQFIPFEDNKMSAFDISGRVSQTGSLESISFGFSVETLPKCEDVIGVEGEARLFSDPTGARFYTEPAFRRAAATFDSFLELASRGILQARTRG